MPSHIPVLLREVLSALAPRVGETYADCTAGLGGHAAAVAGQMAEGRDERVEMAEGIGTIVLNDADAVNLGRATANVECVSGGAARVVSFQGNFADLPRKMAEAGLSADMVLADLGFASNQVDEASRGFSFMREGPLDMRLDPSRGMSAADLVNKASEGELTAILRDYGEEPGARRIAGAIVRARKAGPLMTTTALAELVRGTIGQRPGGNHAATKTFQGLRIAVNDELGSLEALLAAIRRGAEGLREEARAGSACHMKAAEGNWLRSGARVGIITFHSLEDRPVKRVFGEMVKEGLAEEIGRGKCAASDEEIAVNPRSRSAKLRAIRLGGFTEPK